MDETAARSILRQLQAHGFEAYFVGGYVRDRLLGEPTHDIDIATAATPADVMRIFPHTVPTGLQHGTVSVIIDKVAYEVTTFRAESDYEQARRPQAVVFIRDLQADLERRDFTINAMALDADERLVDPFGGARDLQARRLRAVGAASERFHEDALRMLRAIRFAAQLDMQIEPLTWQAILSNRQNLQHISIERVRMELDKMMEGRHPLRALALLQQSGLPAHFRTAQGLSAPFAQLDLQQLQGDPTLLTDAVTRWAFLFLALKIDAAGAKTICRELTHANRKGDEIVGVLRLREQLLQGEQQPESMTEAFKKAALAAGADRTARFLDLLDVGVHADFPPATAHALLHNGRRWLAEMPVMQVKQLTVNGRDVMKFIGQKDGPWLKSVLQALLVEVALGRLANVPHDLLARAAMLCSAQPEEANHGS
jgi:tRNA nucleotidyltransferase (CCA-adding enzyme)